MPRISPLDEARLAVLQPLRDRLQSAEHGGKSALVQRAAVQLNCSPQTVWNDLRALGYQSGRRARSDTGASVLTDDEVKAVATICSVAHRQNNKRLMSVKNAMEHAGANGLLRAECSTTTMARRMCALNVHPDQYERPTAHVNLKSKHPNHVWEVDPSLCVLYRLPGGKVIISAAENDDLIYKNKLENLEALNKRVKVWRYVQWDHYSSAFFVRYYETPGESAEVLMEFLIEAATPKPGMAMHGWPDVLLWDKGSANRSAPVKNMLDALGVRHTTHKAKNARAKGGVEGCNNLVETQFEGGLAFSAMPTIAELNQQADAWQRDFNSMRACTRHGHTRYGFWQTIRSEQVRVSPPADRLRMLANSGPEMRKVNGDLTVSLAGRRYDVSLIASVSTGDRLLVALNAYTHESARVLARDDKEQERYHLCAEVTKDDAGFWSNALTIDDGYSALADRPVDVARKDLRETAWGTRDENKAAAARAKGVIPMQGRMDPFRAVAQRQATLPHHMQRTGDEIDVSGHQVVTPDPKRRQSEIHKPNAMHVELKPLDLIDVLRELRARFGRTPTNAEREAVIAWFPDGVPPESLDSLVERLEQLSDAGTPPTPTEAPRLVAVR